MPKQSLEHRQEAMKVSLAARKKALILAKRKARDVKRAYRHNQGQYLRRCAVKKALTKGEREAYQASTKAFYALCAELRDCAARLKGARTSYESALPSVIKLQLEYARGWRESREALLREQAERTT